MLQCDVFCPAAAVGLANPSVAHPARDNHAQGPIGTESTLQSPKVIYRKRGGQLVEDRVIGTISLALDLSIDILTLQGFTEGLDLLRQTVLSHHQGKLDSCF